MIIFKKWNLKNIISFFILKVNKDNKYLVICLLWYNQRRGDYIEKSKVAAIAKEAGVSPEQ